MVKQVAFGVERPWGDFDGQVLNLQELAEDAGGVEIQVGPSDQGSRDPRLGQVFHDQLKRSQHVGGNKGDCPGKAAAVGQLPLQFLPDGFLLAVGQKAWPKEIIGRVLGVSKAGEDRVGKCIIHCFASFYILRSCPL